MAAPASGAHLCRLADLKDPGSRGVVVQEGEELFRAFLVRRGDQVFGYVDRCPHAAYPLSFDGDRFLTREEDFILCSGHGALFRIEDGVCVAGPCAGKRLQAWPVRVRNGEVQVS